MATVTIDADRVSPSRSLAAVARCAPLIALTHRSYAELCDELGSDEAAIRFLLKTATNSGRPILVNFSTGPDTSRTIVIGPKGWTQQKTAGWIAARHGELEAAFGDATPIWEDA